MFEETHKIQTFEYVKIIKNSQQQHKVTSDENKVNFLQNREKDDLQINPLRADFLESLVWGGGP